MDVNGRLDCLEKELEELKRRRALERQWLEDLIRYSNRRMGARLIHFHDLYQVYFEIFKEEHSPEIREKIERELKIKKDAYKISVKKFEKYVDDHYTKLQDKKDYFRVQINPNILRKIADAMDESGDGCICRFEDGQYVGVEFCRDDKLECPETVYFESNHSGK